MTGTEARLQDPQNTWLSALGDSDLTESLDDKMSMKPD